MPDLIAHLDVISPLALTVLCLLTVTAMAATGCVVLRRRARWVLRASSSAVLTLILVGLTGLDFVNAHYGYLPTSVT